MTTPAPSPLDALIGEIASHCASFFWNDVDVGLLHCDWRDRLQTLAASLAKERQAREGELAFIRVRDEHANNCIESRNRRLSEFAVTIERLTERAETAEAKLEAETQARQEAETKYAELLARIGQLDVQPSPQRAANGSKG